MHHCIIILLLIWRDKPPNGITPGYQQTGSIKLFKQKIVLCAATAFTAATRVEKSLLEAATATIVLLSAFGSAAAGRAVKRTAAELRRTTKFLGFMILVGWFVCLLAATAATLCL